ncbi:MAG TPA: hypothetical protein VF631_03405 [Allosphingosinicella sp.]|jgi:hypothetical protein|uniref:hypothetical protein n=1 Tax=Allosphingosinicella sp. TaxID=2823234 RepID=UPI002F2734B5
MRRLLTALLGTALLATPALSKSRLAPEAELADAIKGRVAGEPVGCINLSNVRSVRIINRTAIIYDAGRVLYVNRPRGGAESLDQWDTLVTRLHTNQLCRPEVVRLYDSASRFETGVVFLGDFIPYRRIR